MAKQHPSGALPRSGRGQRLRVRLTDSYGLVLLLLLLDYLAISSIGAYLWGNAVIILLLGFTLLFALRTSLSRRIWQLMALIFLVAGMVSAIVAAIMPGILPVEPIATLSAGVLLIATPFVILRRIIKHQIVTVETILGAVSVYLLLGFSFASIYALISLFAPSPFFADYPHTAKASDYLFFSYTTLTTVGYGNLVPAGDIGRMFAMIEALFGQIYLVIVVARLVSLWGRHPPSANGDSQPDRAQPVVELEREA